VKLVAAVLALVATACAGAASGTTPPPAALRAGTSARTEATSNSEVSKLATSTWCGTAASADRAPNIVAGNPVHWVYLLPSDGPDRLSTMGSVMQSDAEQVDAWWHGQDSTRTPRNDLAPFSCGNQLDITTVRATGSGAQLAPLSGRFAALVDAVERTGGLASPTTKYIAYYDGPSADANTCGQGGGDPAGFGIAIVYVQACAGVGSDEVSAHELLHTFGAVPDGAPHGCTGATAGHTCDNPNDLMYPSTAGQPLSAKILDPGRDDYYGHSGNWIDTQDSPWLVRLDAQTPLAVSISGPGSVSADVPGLLCSTSCTTTWNTGQRLALAATPRAGARLVRWTGACTGDAQCALSVTSGKSVAALFGPATFRLTVAVAGKGVVRTGTAGIACRPKCSASFRSFTPVRLAATPTQGWRFRSWSGACSGSRATCTVPMKAATSARARFVRQ